MSNTLLRMAQHFKWLPHQVKAFEYLDNIIEDDGYINGGEIAKALEIYRNTDDSLPQARVKAFLDLIAWCEGTDGPTGYRTMFTHKLFTDFTDHPRQLQGPSYLRSDAAGRYQFLSTTWDEAKEAIGLDSFEPDNQDKAAIWLIDVKRDALKEIQEGDIKAALTKLSYEWASLPPGQYGQPIKSYEECYSYFEQQLNKYLA